MNDREWMLHEAFDCEQRIVPASITKSDGVVGAARTKAFSGLMDRKTR
jgi:hypothetical protein